MSCSGKAFEAMCTEYSKWTSLNRECEPAVQGRVFLLDREHKSPFDISRGGNGTLVATMSHRRSESVREKEREKRRGSGDGFFGALPW